MPSENLYTIFQFTGADINISEAYTRMRLDNQLRRTVDRINAGLDQVLQRAGLASDQIDVVLRTGGSASIPLYIDLLEARFGKDRVVAQDAFTSITAGLAIVAHERYG